MQIRRRMGGVALSLRAMYPLECYIVINTFFLVNNAGIMREGVSRNCNYFRAKNNISPRSIFFS